MNSIHKCHDNRGFKCHTHKCNICKCDPCRCHTNRCHDCDCDPCRCHTNRCHDCGCDPCRCKPCKCEPVFESNDCCNCAHCVPGHPLPTQAISACGCGSGVAIPLSTLATTFNPIPVASVTIDTTCLCQPSVKIDFNAIINYQALITTGTLLSPFTVTFQLSKTCNGGSKIPLGSWDYSQSPLNLLVNTTHSFSFTHCECKACPGCCVYSVEIIRASSSILTGAGATLTENASIRSSSISASASSSC